MIGRKGKRSRKEAKRSERPVVHVLCRRAGAGLVGLSLSYALAITGLLNSVLTSFAETEQELVAVERILDYSALPPQARARACQAAQAASLLPACVLACLVPRGGCAAAPHRLQLALLQEALGSSGSDMLPRHLAAGPALFTPSRMLQSGHTPLVAPAVPEQDRDRCMQADTAALTAAEEGGAAPLEAAGHAPASWPRFGHILFAGACLRYGAAPRLALDRLDLEVQPGQKLGICGRTGVSLLMPQSAAFDVRDILKPY